MPNTRLPRCASTPPAPGAPPAQARGALAETLAARHLESRGLTILARNLRCRLGEIDLLCQHGAVLVVVEVRTRTRTDFGGALASVDGRKRRKLLRATAALVLRRAEWRQRRIRFDVVAVHEPEGAAPRFEWIVDAFRAG